MNLDRTGINFLKQVEGFRNRAYLDIKGIATIGYGTTVYPSGREVKIGDICVPEMAEAYMLHDLDIFEAAVNSVLDTDPIYNAQGELLAHSPTQNMYNALVALCYNIGEKAFKRSTVLRRVNAFTRIDRRSIEISFMMWNQITVIREGVARKEVSPGLAMRRKKEIELYFS